LKPHSALQRRVLFPTHLVVAVGFGRLFDGRVSTAATGERSWPALSTAWLVAGAALPDLVDKPLAMFGVTELFHSVGHSALLLPLAVGVAASSRRGVALAVGWASHLALDAVHIVVNGRPSDALFLAWPLAVPPDPLALPPLAFVGYYLWSPSFFLECLLWLAVGLLVAWPRFRPAAGEKNQ